MTITRTEIETQHLIDQAKQSQNTEDLVSFIKDYENNFYNKNIAPPSEMAEILAHMILEFKSSLPKLEKQDMKLKDYIVSNDISYHFCFYSSDNAYNIREESMFNYHKCLLAKQLASVLSKTKRKKIYSICNDYRNYFYNEIGSCEKESWVIFSSKINFSLLYTFINQRCFQRAVLKGNEEKVKSLLENTRVCPESNNNFSLRAAALHGHTKIVEMLIKNRKVDPAADNFFSLRTAVYFNYFSIVKILVESGKVELDQIKIVNDLTLIKMSLPKGASTQFAVSTYLMKKNILPVETDFFPAIQYGNFEIVKNLVESGVDPALNNNWAICVAAAVNHVEIIEYLLSDKRVDPTVNFGDPLYQACSFGNAGAVTVLLRHPQVEPGFNNLFIACKKGHAGIISLLLKDPRTKQYLYESRDKKLVEAALASKSFEAVTVLMNDLRFRTPENFNLIKEFKQSHENRYINYCRFKKTFTLGISYPRFLFYKNTEGQIVKEKKYSFYGFPKEVIAIIGEQLFADIKIDKNLLFFPPSFPKKVCLTSPTFSFYQSKNSISTCVFLKFTTRKEARVFVGKYKIDSEIWEPRFLNYQHVIDMKTAPGFAVVKIPASKKNYEKFKNKHPALNLSSLDKLHVEPIRPYRKDGPVETCINKIETHIWSLSPNEKKYNEIVYSAEKMITFLENTYVKFNHDDYTILTKGRLGNIIKECPEADREIQKQSFFNRIAKRF